MEGLLSAVIILSILLQIILVLLAATFICLSFDRFLLSWHLWCCKRFDLVEIQDFLGVLANEHFYFGFQFLDFLLWHIEVILHLFQLRSNLLRVVLLQVVFEIQLVEASVQLELHEELQEFLLSPRPLLLTVLALILIARGLRLTRLLLIGAPKLGGRSHQAVATSTLGHAHLTILAYGHCLALLTALRCILLHLCSWKRKVWAAVRLLSLCYQKTVGARGPARTRWFHGGGGDLRGRTRSLSAALRS